jgi:hypothetical protein
MDDSSKFIGHNGNLISGRIGYKTFRILNTPREYKVAQSKEKSDKLELLQPSTIRFQIMGWRSGKVLLLRSAEAQVTDFNSLDLPSAGGF